jgi:hypothetical protein
MRVMAAASKLTAAAGRSPTARDHAAEKRRSPTSTAVRLPAVARRVGRPRLTSASSTTSSWASDAAWMSSVTAASRTASSGKAEAEARLVDEARPDPLAAPPRQVGYLDLLERRRFGHDPRHLRVDRVQERESAARLGGGAGERRHRHGGSSSPPPVHHVGDAAAHLTSAISVRRGRRYTYSYH